MMKCDCCDGHDHVQNLESTGGTTPVISLCGACKARYLNDVKNSRHLISGNEKVSEVHGDFSQFPTGLKMQWALPRLFD